jgi:hypothetical protein
MRALVALASFACSLAWADSTITNGESLNIYLANDPSLSSSWEAVNIPIAKSSNTIPGARHRSSGLNCSIPRVVSLTLIRDVAVDAIRQGECRYISRDTGGIEALIRFAPAGMEQSLDAFAKLQSDELVKSIGASISTAVTTANGWSNTTKYTQLQYERDGRVHIVDAFYTEAPGWFVEVRSDGPDTQNPATRYLVGSMLVAFLRAKPTP